MKKHNFLSQVQDIIHEHSPISFLVNIGDLEGVEPGAFLADMKFGFSHIKDISRMALVGDQKWCQFLASLPNPFSLEIKAFDEKSEDDAWFWVIS